MRRASGPCKLHSVEVLDLAYKRGSLTAEFALHGDNEGAGPVIKSGGWSEATKKRLEDLLAAMEGDLLLDLFSSGPAQPSIELPKQL